MDKLLKLEGPIETEVQTEFMNELSEEKYYCLKIPERGIKKMTNFSDYDAKINEFIDVEKQNEMTKLEEEEKKLE